MPPFRFTSRLLQAAVSPPFQAKNTPDSALASRIAAAFTRNAPLVPILPECPSPTCACAPMPESLDIDHKTQISNNIAPYTSHILISTGQSDWTSRIEDAVKDTTTWPWGQLISQVKTAFGRKGRYHSYTQNVLITASSLPPKQESHRTVLLFPANEELSITPPPSSSSASSPAETTEPDTALTTLLSYLATRSSSPSASATSPPPAPITTKPLIHPTILICSHNSRDTRCGILGPLLHREFQQHISSHDPNKNIRVAMVSHVGGHKWAGNVIIYIPPDWSAQSPTSASSSNKGETSLLAHKAIWYGRVEPRHVEGIVRETVLGGRVIGELCRGVVDRDGRLVGI